jgi:EmrB/QacA subfamily drug resistance transporter
MDQTQPTASACPDPDRRFPTASEKKITLFIAILAGFLTPFDTSAVNIALPAIDAEFGMSAVSLSWISTAYLLSTAIFLVPFGKLSDIYGRRKIFLIGISIFTLASFLSPFAPETGILIGMRVLQGIGAAMIFGTCMAILTATFPAGERGKAIGIYIVSPYLGLSLGPLIGGSLTQYLGWRSIFYINVPIGLLAIALICWKLHREQPDCPDEKFDLAGSVIYGLAIIAIMYGISILPETVGFVLVVLGICGIALFASYELHTENPVLEIRLFTKNRVFAFSNITALISYAATFAITFLLSLDLQYTKGLSPQDAGLILIVQPLVQMTFAPISGRLSDRFETRYLASAGMGLVTTGLFLLIFLNEGTPIWYLVICQLILGAGFGIFVSPNSNAIMSSVGHEYYGVASATMSAMRLLGQMISMGCAIMLFALIIGPVQITPQYYPQFTLCMHISFLIFCCLCGAGIIFSLMRGEKHKGAEGRSATLSVHTR